MTKNKHVVGGVEADRPFKARRLGHTAIDIDSARTSLDFYVRDLGLSTSDSIDTHAIPSLGDIADRLDDPHAYFLSTGADHHSVVLMPREIALARRNADISPEVTNGQISFQVSSLKEVLEAKSFLEERGLNVPRLSRDLPGSNWHTYFMDPDQMIVELYYGMEQMGWARQSKPSSMYYRRIHGSVTMPQPSEQAEVAEAIERGLNIFAGHRAPPAEGREFEVGGVVLKRPFRVHKLGPIGMFVKDIDRSVAFYSGALGFSLTEEVAIDNERCVFLRLGTDHHVLALYPLSLREKLEIERRSTTFYMGFQLGSYDQLRAAGHFLKAKGYSVQSTPWPHMHPGIDRVLYVVDPQGNRILLYYYMEQIGWDGRPSGLRANDATPLDQWPECVAGRPDVYCDAPLMGPLG